MAQLEVLAPAGSRQALKAAVACGAGLADASLARASCSTVARAAAGLRPQLPRVTAQPASRGSASAVIPHQTVTASSPAAASRVPHRPIRPPPFRSRILPRYAARGGYMPVCQSGGIEPIPPDPPEIMAKSIWPCGY